MSTRTGEYLADPVALANLARATMNTQDRVTMAEDLRHARGLPYDPAGSIAMALAEQTRMVSVRALSVDELADLVRHAPVNYPKPIAPETTVARHVPYRRVAQLVTTVTPTGGRWRAYTEGGTGATTVTGRPFGVAADELSIVFDAQDSAGIRLPIYGGPVRNAILEDRSLSRQFIDGVLTRDWMTSLDAQLTSGSGVRNTTEQNLTGIFVDAAITSLARDTAAAETRVAAIERGIERVGLDDHEPPYALVVNPSTWLAIRQEDASNVRLLDALDDVDAVAVTSHAPAGQVVVGRVDLGVTLALLEDANITVSNSHGSLFVARQSAVVLESQVESRTVRPSALRRLTDMG